MYVHKVEKTIAIPLIDCFKNQDIDAALRYKIFALEFGGDVSLKIRRPSALPHEDARSRWEGAPVTPLSRPRGNRTKLVEIPRDRRRI